MAWPTLYVNFLDSIWLSVNIFQRVADTVINIIITTLSRPRTGSLLKSGSTTQRVRMRREALFGVILCCLRCCVRRRSRLLTQVQLPCPRGQVKKDLSPSLPFFRKSTSVGQVMMYDKRSTWSWSGETSSRKKKILNYHETFECIE